MKKITNQKFRSYTALALAFILASPLQSLAASENISNAVLSIPTEHSEIKAENEETLIEKTAYTPEITQSLSEDGRQVIYNISLTKNTENPANIKAYINLPNGSNFKNLTAKFGDTTKSLSEGSNLIKLDLPADTTNLQIEAEIKDNSTENLYYDLLLVDAENAYKNASRIASKILIENDTKRLEEIAQSQIVSNLVGKFVNETEIEWTGYLLNTTDSPQSSTYNFKSIEGVDISDSKIVSEAFALQSGKLEKSTKEDGFGDINCAIAGHDIVKFTFKTKAKADATRHSINGVEVKNPYSHENPTENQNQEPSTDEAKSQEQVEKIIKDLEKGSDELENAITELDKSLNNDQYEKTVKELKPAETDKKLEVVTLDGNEESPAPAQESKVDLTKTDNENKSEDINKLKKNIESANGQTLEILKQNNQVNPLMIQTPAALSKTPQGLVDIDALIKQIKDADRKIEALAREIYGDVAYDSVLNLKKDESGADTRKLAADINATNQEIKNVLEEPTIKKQKPEKVLGELKKGKLRDLDKVKTITLDPLNGIIIKQDEGSIRLNFADLNN